MLFSSPAYILLFLPIVLIIYFTLNRYYLFKASELWLIFASLVFYSFSSFVYLPILTISILVNYLHSYILYNKLPTLCTPKKITARKAVLIGGISLNIISLAYFKYVGFFLDIFHNSDFLLLAAPLAISFYTFQQISYLVDSYFSKIKDTSFLSYCSFVLFFPKLVAGPITRYKEFIPSYLDTKNKHIDWQNIAMGLFVFSVGLFKKIYIAEHFAIWANAGFESVETLSLFESWVTSLSYTFQLYFDFSGYSDMAIGSALFFNIPIPQNFNSPYKSSNIQDFWRRWHITLSLWLRDYLYIPLGGNKKGEIRTIINISITFVIAGIWHGAGWTFLFWGCLHGGALSFYRLWQKTRIKFSYIAGWMVTFLFINVTWVFFRADNLSQGLSILKSMIGLGPIDIPFILSDIINKFTFFDCSKISAVNDPMIFSYQSVLFLIVFSLLSFFAPNTMQLINKVSYTGLFRFETSIITAVLVSFLLFASLLTFTGHVMPSNFVYFSF